MTTPVEVNTLMLSGNDGLHSNITKSLRFRSSAGGYMTRTFGAPTDATKWTWSGWLKRGNIGTQGFITSNYLDLSNYVYFTFQAANTIRAVTAVAGTPYVGETTAIFSDASSWYHCVLSCDSNNATAANRFILYVNGVQVPFSSTPWPQQAGGYSYNYSGANPALGAANGTPANIDGLYSEVNFIDGQALTPSSFGQNNATTGVWEPKSYTGSYGANGSYLKFTNTTSTTTLGNDFSGNGNNWTPNNISLTAGSTYDSMLDVPPPQPYGSLVASTQPVGNYATFNPLNVNSGTISNGNLLASVGPSNTSTAVNTIPVSAGKWYWEITCGANTTNDMLIGIVDASRDQSLRNYNNVNAWYYYGSNGNKIYAATQTGYGASYTTGDVIGTALDMDAGSVTFYKNGVSQGVAFNTGISGLSIVAVVGQATSVGTQNYNLNAGQQPFQYTPPTGYKSLCTTNLPEPSILNGASYMDATLYTGTGAALTINNGSGSGNNPLGKTFYPDLTWIKSRSNATNHNLFDSVRGATNYLISNSQNAQATDANTLTAFNSNGFALGTDGSSAGVNISGNTYVGWQWNANGGTTSSNTSGSVTSTVCVNQTAGFSIVQFTPTTGNDTIGHGLGAAPSFIIAKYKPISTNWAVYHSSLGATNYMRLNDTSSVSSGDVWGNTTPTSSVFSIGSASFTTANPVIAYCWTPIPGYSSFGSYTGNGSTNGPFVYTGFRPRFVLIKNTTAYSWYIYDTTRSTYNTMSAVLYPNTNNLEETQPCINACANGFQLADSGPAFNNNGDIMIYAAFAENPFQYALAR